ncbi:UvrD-helicase domain-containing protein [Halovenus marina]|uniref:UvrD-helicase domain-containing protein n=1 Tax=Halovenus marina TaxID=3396621 RepID=UPI003F55BB6E
MTDFEPNDQQQELIDATSGIHVVDAGAGTGKTFTITRRYANLLQQDETEPDDILLITFTNNAAAEMKERVVANCDYSMSALRDAPINTFHGHCHELLLRNGFSAPTHLGIDDRITSSTRLLENEVVEEDRFREFMSQFADEHPEHHDFLRVLRENTSLLEVIRELAAKGIFPTVDGWYRNGESYLDGDFEAFEELFEAANEPNEGANGPTQSDLRDGLSGFERGRCFLPDAPAESELRDNYPSIDHEWAERAFDEERDALKAFVHDIYFEYIEFALRQNYLNFSFLQMFAFVLLCEDHVLREAVQFDHVMVDEFQDTSEIQFKLALLLAGTDNFCVVGDWKQSIYGFQYASVDNIRQFEERLENYKRELNSDSERVAFPVDDVTEIKLEKNYRSTQSILDFSRHSLGLPATSNEEVDLDIEDDITPLTATTDHDHSNIEAFTSDDECEAILTRVQEIVGNRAYAVEDEDGELRPPSHEDIAVLTRTRRFGRELQSDAREYNIPVAYEGGVELFGTEQAILLLAWLRLLEDRHSERGWAVVLEEAGYTLDEVKAILENESYPSNMLSFRERLASGETVGGIARLVFDRYGFEDAYADALVAVLQGTFDSTTHNRGAIIRFMEQSLEADATHDVDDNPGGDSITVQTIHAAKGLEHPIVILANINQYSFPPSGGGADRIRYEDPVGLRQTKDYADAHGRPHIYDNWRYRILSKCLNRDYDEERRLMYVAITRAESHVLFSAGPSPSPLFENLPLEPETVEPDVEEAGTARTEQSRLQVSVPVPDIPAGQSPHSLMDDHVFSDADDGRGIEFGNQVHDFAEQYAEGAVVEPSNEDERHVAEFLDSLDGELRAEENAYLPVTVGEQQVTISGIIDLLHVAEDRIDIVDYKTDIGRHAESEYRKQLSVYYHVVRAAFRDYRVTTALFYTADGDRIKIDPLSKDEIADLIDRDYAEAQPDSEEDPIIR